jgi:hypothetical protein
MRPVDPSTQVLINVIVEEVLTCSLCDNKMSLSAKGRLPKSLDCSHTYCMLCMEKYKSGMGIFSTIVCPCCTVETTVGISGVSGLKNNHTVISLINILEVFNAFTCVVCSVKPATLRCYTCPEKHSLCESCHGNPSGDHTLHDVREIAMLTPEAVQKKHYTTPNASRASPIGFKKEDMTSVIECPRSIVGKVISSQGNSFDNVRAQTCCTIEFRRLSDRQAPALIAIRGPKASVLQARRMIEQIMGEVVLADVDDSSAQAQTRYGSELGNEDIRIEISHYDAIVLFELR